MNEREFRFLGWLMDHPWVFVVVVVVIGMLLLHDAWTSARGMLALLASPFLALRDWLRLRRSNRELERLQKMELDRTGKP